VPNLHLTRGGMAPMVNALFTAYTPTTYSTALAALALSGALAFFLLQFFARSAATGITRISQRLLAADELSGRALAADHVEYGRVGDGR